MKKSILLILAICSSLQYIKAQDEDAYLWLEEANSKKATEWVDKQNQVTVDKFKAEKPFSHIYSKCLEIFNRTDRIADPRICGNFVYNLWQDKTHEKGIWRRMLKENYVKGDTIWDILLDVDDLSKRDKVDWVYVDAYGLYPKYGKFLIYLSKGGGDAVVIKEFDVTTKSFVENGFQVAEAKGTALYLNENTLIVSSDFGQGTLTTAGYPKQVKLWKRGTLLKDAQLIFEGKDTDVGTYSYTMRDDSISYLMVFQNLSSIANQVFVWQDNKLIRVEIPNGTQISGLINNQLILNLKSDWTINEKVYKKGSLVSANFKSLLKGQKEVHLILEPDEFTSISDVSQTKNRLLVNTLTNVKSELYTCSFDNGEWTKTKVNAPDFGIITLVSPDEFSDQYFFNFQNFLVPSTLYLADAKANSLKPFKSLPGFFDLNKYNVTQYKAKSKDGTMIPYFVVASKKMVLDGKNPTLLNAYGGFEVSSLPFYSSVRGIAWLEYGGVYVLANIRGGGEFGPDWHEAGILEKRQNVYDDFIAVSEDLIAKKITSNKHLGIIGGSNGGLLVGVAFTERPDLCNAVICSVPVLDMKRFTKLGTGAGSIGEYGDPDKPEDWEYIKKYSPYHNLRKETKYPEVFFTANTMDDRVTPSHARKMVAKMSDMGHKVYYYESKGGHTGSGDFENLAKVMALEYTYLLMKLKVKD